MAVEKGSEKWKLKKWFSVYAPEILGGSIISEIPSADESNVIGRMIKVNMSWITNRAENAFTQVGLKITDVNGIAAHTQLKYMEQTYSYLHSLVRRHSTTIHTMERLSDRDKKGIVLKLLVVTHNKATTKKRTSIRKELAAFSKEYASGRSSSDIVKGIVDGSFQKEAAMRIRDICSVSKLELKKIEL